MYLYQYHYLVNAPLYNYERQPVYRNILNGTIQNGFKDYGPEPFGVNINEATKQNLPYSFMDGDRLQIALMSFNVAKDIGLEMYPNVDQFLRIEQGQRLFKWTRVKIILTLKEMSMTILQ